MKDPLKPEDPSKYFPVQVSKGKKGFREIAEKIWNDPVWSNLIANGITALAAWLFLRLVSTGNGNSIPAVMNSDLKRPVATPGDLSILPETIKVFLYIFLGCLGILVLVFLWRMRQGKPNDKA